MNKLINDIRTGIEKKSSYVSVIAKPKMLLTSLCDLNDMVGNDEVKDDVAGQVVHLIANKMKEAKKGKSTKPLMLHSLLCGPPGVGKTTIGVHLARIWYSLGYIGKDSVSRNYKSSSDTKEKSMIDDVFSGNSDAMMNLYMTLLILFILFSILITLANYVYKACSYCSQTIGLKWTMIILSIVILILVIVSISYYLSSKPSKKIVVKSTNNNDNSDVEEDNLIKVVSAEDFIGQYVGWTEKKTTELLQSCKGKVLFIDEAYNLISGGMHGDSFGEKALGIINRYMSEHPEELIIIMAGYRDKIQNLFNVQPGLVSRFMWSFDCKGYTADELFIIWKQQLLPWKLVNENTAKEVFVLNNDLFKNYARDTSKLANFCLIEHDRDIISNEDQDDETLTTEQITRGIQMLRRNTVKNGTSNDDTSKLIDMIKRMS